jgi:hypothetical protein
MEAEGGEEPAKVEHVARAPTPPKTDDQPAETAEMEVDDGSGEPPAVEPTDPTHASADDAAADPEAAQAMDVAEAAETETQVERGAVESVEVRLPAHTHASPCTHTCVSLHTHMRLPAHTHARRVALARGTWGAFPLTVDGRARL